MQKEADVYTVIQPQLTVTKLHILQHFTFRLMASLYDLVRLHQKAN
jgi:hypothetical protein